MTTSQSPVLDTYRALHPKSQALYERARGVIPGGVTHDGRHLRPFPIYVERAQGALKWDVDGHAYIDCWSGHGALMLGHNHPVVVEAIAEQARKGLHYSACSELEVRWAELIRGCVPGAERVRFTLTGTETTSLAVRVARAFTGRDHIIKFESHFHGVHDMFVAAVKDPLELPASEREVVVLRHYHELPFPTIAEILGAPVTTVKSRMSRGLFLLRARLVALET